MSKVIKDALKWLEDVDESACFCEIGETANGQPYHTLECVKTSAHIVRTLVANLKRREAELRPKKRAADLAEPIRTDCVITPKAVRAITAES